MGSLKTRGASGRTARRPLLRQKELPFTARANQNSPTAGRDKGSATARTRRVERFFTRVGVVLTSLLLTAALVNAACFVVLRYYEPREGRRLDERRNALMAGIGRPRGVGGGPRVPLWDLMSASPVYDPFPWAEEFWREERARLLKFRRSCYAPYRLWANCGPHRGKFVNISEDGFRLSPDPLGAEGPGETFDIFVLGGSAAYGWGVPDSETITAHLADIIRQKLEKSGEAHAVRVVNLGVPAYNSTQEVLLLVELLKKGHRPDLVIFYDGANDATIAPGLHWDFEGIKNKLEGVPAPSPWVELLRGTAAFRLAALVRKQLAGGTDSRDAAGRTEAAGAEQTDEFLRARAGRILDGWLSDRKVVDGLAQVYSFRHLHVWQPAFFYGSKPLGGGERVLAEHPELFFINNLDANASRAFARGVRACYEEAERRAAGGDFLFLADAFDQTAEPVYVDWVHTGPRGNRIVASRIAEHLEAGRRPPFAEGR